MRLHPFAGKSTRRPIAVIEIPTNSETSKIRMKTPMKHCYSKSYSPESSLDYERQVMLQRCFIVVFAVSEFVLQPLSDASKGEYPH